MPKKHRLANHGPSITHHDRMTKRREAYQTYQATIPPLDKSELLLTGKYIPAGQFKNLQPHNR